MKRGCSIGIWEEIRLPPIFGTGVQNRLCRRTLRSRRALRIVSGFRAGFIAALLLVVWEVS